MAVLGLPSLGQISAYLADDSSTKVNVYEATIMWHGEEIHVAELAMGKRPLLGTTLLEGFNLNADFEVDGTAVLEHL